ncbi:hypothetical protein BDV41DRAFT_531765, partial [Aspergillus transmontanensis]
MASPSASISKPSAMAMQSANLIMYLQRLVRDKVGKGKIWRECSQMLYLIISSLMISSHLITYPLKKLTKDYSV